MIPRMMTFWVLTFWSFAASLYPMTRKKRDAA